MVVGKHKTNIDRITQTLQNKLQSLILNAHFTCIDNFEHHQRVAELFLKKILQQNFKANGPEIILLFTHK